MQNIPSPSLLTIVAAISSDPVVQTHVLTHPAFQTPQLVLHHNKQGKITRTISHLLQQDSQTALTSQNWEVYTAQIETRARRAYISTRNRLFSRPYRDSIKLEARQAGDVGEEKRLDRLFGVELNDDARNLAKGRLLNELKRAFNRDADLQFHEIETLWRLYQSTRVCWLLSHHGKVRTVLELVVEMADLQERLVLKGPFELDNLDNRLDFIERQVFADGKQRAGQLKTRVARMMAADVDPEIRNEVREKRLENADAIEYSLWLREDLYFLRAWQANVHITLCRLEKDIESLAMAWMDIHDLCETALLVSAVDQGDK